jgi:tRNA (guanine26-N2/guanine27-N2)-dimethyltransferase
MNQFEQTAEGKALVFVPKEKKVSKKLPVFYNPAMKLNRDISVLLLNSVENKSMQIALPLAGTGVRGVRFLLELKKGKIKNINMNDYGDEPAKIINKNLKLNKIKKSSKIKITKKDANMFLLESSGFDYIDIDPFGTPNYFLDSAVKRLARGGILAVTATDTSALAGTFPSACKRKYWAVPLRNELKHEIGLRILIRKVQLIAAQFEKALTPIYSYSDQHYMRVFFSCEKGKHKADKIIEQQGNYEKAGPIWLGKLWDKRLASKIAKQSDERILRLIAEESKLDTVGFHDMHKICKRSKIKNIPKTKDIIKAIKKKGYKAAETHFSPSSLRSDIPLKTLLKLLTKTF